MGAVRLGRIGLKWCMSCNVPLVELEKCGKCGSQSQPVEITPPGDYRPAFPHDIARIRKTIDANYGPGTGIAMIPNGHLVVLNKSPAVDIMDEVAMNGIVLGSHIFEPGTGWHFICRIEGARRIAKIATKNWAIIDEGAIPYIRKGASSMAVGIITADPDIRVGGEIIVLSNSREAISTGRARMTGTQMVESERDAAIKSRWYKEVPENEELPGGQTWQDAVRANEKKLEKKRKNSRGHIRITANRFSELPVAVSVSGGKDSLATLLLVLEAGFKPKLIFTDTGLEFPETVANVLRTAEKYGLELIIEDAGDAFWRALEHFGPPAKDFRWCCKTCKLGPMANLIRKNFPNGVLSFIGQRQYESSQRYEKGNVWHNPWVPGQIGASPIQNWPALLVWLYIFQQSGEYNPLYERGLERIGCWLCPATDMGEFEDVEKYSAQNERWQTALKDFAAGKNLPEEWLELGLWRWKKLPKGMADYMEQKGISIALEKDPEASASELSEEENKRLERFSNVSQDAREVRMKALHCVGCGICISLCEFGALEMDGYRVDIDPEKCTGCGQCMHPCAVIDFGPR
ncbi:MAG: phosphoadenosine phosphosulfate reductase family protein [Candidatus Thermoplasmatota archaeon]|nr:4Fe-4S dicluster domain-containing protein [Euryarchaeota archaeon]MBU4031781.1 phosphoadenosine phosphosulfate reductase family protein [Candidatus Thermoplasmatota archaeon]MBU4071696.1 phosphoadenosine phosphosulfate reductase family protein [Candidatus Thermoplasmatota archaeon]MBU4143775.1 phosphoadenosine phosphosulfate reductase family protein [Candidatus Thermoplasmatota archaeon]MBU4591391.1 phosphoadenosine phosphosulfate reductase family protein [Candidatus Thermoplasmatota archae